MSEYNLSEFRANTKKAFDEAERGEVVVIDRYGTDFYLVEKSNWSPPDTANNAILDSRGMDYSQNIELTPENTVRPRLHQKDYHHLLAPTMKIGVTLHNLRKETIS